MSSFRPFSGQSHTIQQGRNSTSNINEIITSDTFLHRMLNSRRGSGSNSSQNIIQLEEEIDVDRNLEIYNNHSFDILQPRVLYQAGRIYINTSFIKGSREVSTRV